MDNWTWRNGIFSFYNDEANKKVNVTIRDSLPLLASEMFSILDTGKVWTTYILIIIIIIFIMAILAKWIDFLGPSCSFIIIKPLEGLQQRSTRLLSNKSTAPTWQGWSLVTLLIHELISDDITSQVYGLGDEWLHNLMFHVDDIDDMFSPPSMQRWPAMLHSCKRRKN